MNRFSYGSSKGESKSLNARIEKLYLELSLGDGFWLPYQLKEPLFGNCPVTTFVNVESASDSRRLFVQNNAKSHRRPRLCRSHNEMKIAGVKAARNAPA